MPPAKPQVEGIGLAELVSALSHALDLTEGQPAGHSVRCCWIGLNVGRRIGLGDQALSDLYYTLLLKDVGCSSNAARLCQLYLADDHSFKRDFKLVSDSLPQLLGFVLTHTGMKAGLAERFRAVVNIAVNGGGLTRELIETRCQRGAEIVRAMRFPESVAQGILDLDEHWNGNGHPMGLAGAEIALNARIALMAQVVDVFSFAGHRRNALRELRRRSGAWFDPALVAAFEAVAADEDFWAALASPDLQDRVVASEPRPQVITVDDDYLDDVAAAFARVIDAKSPYTAGHSDRVALFADLIAEALGLSPSRRRHLKRAALLHDIGKLGVSGLVLDKPGRLDAGEWAEMQGHAELGEAILSRISAFADLARVAGAHHEKLDGSGYPRRRSAADLDLETRIVTVADIFDALTADRPYRPAMPLPEAFAIMAGMAGTEIDADCLGALKRGMDLVAEAAA